MIIGVDPHKTSHTANAVDSATNTPVGSLRVDANLSGYRQLLRWTRRFSERSWAVRERSRSDREDSSMLADLVHTDRHNHHPVAGDSRPSGRHQDHGPHTSEYPAGSGQRFEVDPLRWTLR